MTITLADFLLARIAEEEAAVRQASHADDPYFGHLSTVSECDCEYDHAYAVYLAVDPARVLAECEAKRRIVEWHKAWPVLVETPPTIEPLGDDLQSTTVSMSRQIAWLTEQEYRKRFGAEPPTGPVLKLLALPFASHPDYREEWRP